MKIIINFYLLILALAILIFKISQMISKYKTFCYQSKDYAVSVKILITINF